VRIYISIIYFKQFRSSKAIPLRAFSIASRGRPGNTISPSIRKRWRRDMRVMKGLSRVARIKKLRKKNPSSFKEMNQPKKEESKSISNHWKIRSMNFKQNTIN
jgi:hypothetical protein